MNEKETFDKEDSIVKEWEKWLDPKLKNEIDWVKRVIQETVLDFHNYIFPKYIKNYKSYLWFVAERLASLDWWQSNVNYPMVSSAVDTMFANVFDFWYEFWINEEWLKRLCTKSFDFRDAGKNTFKETTKECLITGTAFARDYIIYEEHKDNFFWKDIITKIKMPTLEYISVFDVMYDKSKPIEKSAYKIIRTFMTGDAVFKKIVPLLLAQSKEWLTTEWKNNIEKSFKTILWKLKWEFWSRFSMYDYNPVKSLMSASDWFSSLPDNSFFRLPVCKTQKELVWWISSDSEDAKNYFLNINKSTYEVVEYFTKDKKYIFINWSLVYFGNRRHQLSEIRKITFSNIPGTWNSLWLSDKLGNIQELQNMLWNAFADNLKLLLWPMFKVTGNLPIAKSWKLDFWALRAYKTNWAADIEKIQLWVADFAPINFMQMNEWVAVKESWMNNYISWWAWAIERTQAWVDVKFNQYKSKLTPLTDSIDQMMWGIARSWITMFLKFFTKEELQKMDINIEESFITDDNWKQKFDTIKVNWVDIRTIIDETNITFTYNSLHKVTKESTRDTIIRNLQPLLQYAWWSINMKEIWKILAGKDFNPEKIFKDDEVKIVKDTTTPAVENTQEQVQQEEELNPSELSDEELLNQLSNIS